MKYLGLIIAIIIICIVFIISVIYGHFVALNNEITGFWFGDKQFLEQSKLSEMYFYIEDAESQFTGHLYMKDVDDNIISNQGVTFNKPGLLTTSSFTSLTGDAKFTTKFSFDENDVLPTTEITVDIAKQTMVLYDDKKVYALLYKDNTYINE